MPDLGMRKQLDQPLSHPQARAEDRHDPDQVHQHARLRRPQRRRDLTFHDRQVGRRFLRRRVASVLTARRKSAGAVRTSPSAARLCCTTGCDETTTDATKTSSSCLTALRSSSPGPTSCYPTQSTAKGPFRIFFLPASGYPVTARLAGRLPFLLDWLGACAGRSRRHCSGPVAPRDRPAARQPQSGSAVLWPLRPIPPGSTIETQGCRQPCLFISPCSPADREVIPHWCVIEGPES